MSLQSVFETRSRRGKVGIGSLPRNTRRRIP